MRKIHIYTKNWCGYCSTAKELLDSKGVDYTEINITFDPDAEQQMIEWTGLFTVPQIFINGCLIGGSDELAAAENSGNLDRMLGLPALDTVA